jgi:thiol-disulfide isomerase/thioredoxin
MSADPGRLLLAAAVVAAIVVLGTVVSRGRGVGKGAPASRPAGEGKPMTRSAARLPIERELPGFAGATGWINSPPLTPAALRGRVVLVDFWTYTCVNWLRTLPYVRAWAAKYREHGLVVVGVHTPEFSVEHDPANVRRAITDMRIDYPVAIDSDYGVWRAFDNAYWPAVYIADAKGQIRYHHFGEGNYEQTERVIQQLLAERGAAGVPTGLVAVEPRGTEVGADWSDVRSGEAYVGYEKAEGFASPGPIARDARRVYALPSRFGLNQWALSGDWTVGEEIARLNEPSGKIAYRFHARDVNLVMGSASPEKPVRFRVRIDGRPPDAAHGSDVDPLGNGSATFPRLYQLIRQAKPIGDRLFEIEFLDSGAEAFVFTFG